MNEQLITDEFRNMAAEKVFANEVYTVIFHSDNPGPDGLNNTFGDSFGILNMREENWEVGDIGVVQNATDMNVGKLGNSIEVVNYYSLWRDDGTFLGYRKFLRPITILPNDSLRLNSGVIKYKF